MRQDKAKTLKVSITEDQYTSKEIISQCLTYHKNPEDYPEVFIPYLPEPKRLTQVSFSEPLEMTMEDLVKNYLIKGHAACHVHTNYDKDKKYRFTTSAGKEYFLSPMTENGYMRINFKSEEYFTSADFVVVDIDYTPCRSIVEFLSKLDMMPTAVIKSYSHFLDLPNKKGLSPRFHMFYQLEETVTSVSEYREIAKAINRYITKAVPGTDVDNHLTSPSQYFNGYMYKTADREFAVSGYIYTKEDFANYIVEEQEYLQFSDDAVEFDEELIKSVQGLLGNTNLYKGFWSYWYRKAGYNCTFSSAWTFENDVLDRPAGFFKIGHNPHSKVKNGQHRKKSLLACAVVRRAINPTITANELLFSAAYEFARYMDNSDTRDQVTVAHLANIVKNVMAYPMDKVIELANETYQPKFIVNPSLPLNQKRKLIGEYAHKDANKQKDAVLGDCYFDGVTVKQLMDMAEEYGCKYSKSVVYAWLKKNNLSTKPKPKAEYNPNLSERENAVAMGITRDQVRTIKRKLGDFS